MASASTGTVLDAALGALEASQREAVLSDHRAPLLVSAGAGSGKTRVLTLRIAHLIERGGARPEQILALTFTRKACSEMQERVQRFCPMIARHTLTVKTFHSFCLEVSCLSLFVCQLIRKLPVLIFLTLLLSARSFGIFGSASR